MKVEVNHFSQDNQQIERKDITQLCNRYKELHALKNRGKISFEQEQEFNNLITTLEGVGVGVLLDGTDKGDRGIIASDWQVSVREK